MTKATNNVARVAAAVAGLGLIAVSFAPMAGAQTSTTTTTTTTTASVSFSRDLRVGSSGADVSALQTWLIGQGFSIKAGATGFFGGQTKAAVKAFQVANGITPASGYFGPITRAKVAAMGGSSSSSGSVAGCAPGAAFSSTTGQPCGSGSSSTGSLSGGEGLITNFKTVGAASTALNAGASNTVYGVEFQPSGSDLQVGRLSIDATLTGGTGSTRPWTVFNQAKLMRGSTVIATLDASNMNSWSQDGTYANSPNNTVYRLDFTGLNDVVKMGQTVDYYLVLSTQSNINASNNGNIFTVYLPSQGIRATDAKGLSVYSSTVGTNATVSVSSSVAGSLTVSAGNDNPVATTLQASQSAQTSDVTLATFSLQAQSGDVTVYTIPVSIATTSNNASDIVRQIKLYQGSTLLDTESYAAGAISPTSVKFKNLTAKISQGTTQNFRVAADINQVGGSNTVVEGASVAISIPNSGFEAVNSAGNNVSVTGSVTGNVITFRTIGVNATVTAAAPVTAGTNTTSASFSFNVPVTAFGQTAYIASTSSAFTATIHTATTTYAASGVITSSTPTDTASGAFYITPGTTSNFTVTVSAPSGVGPGLNYASLDAIKWGTTGGASTANTFTFPSNSSNRSNAVLLN